MEEQLQDDAAHGSPLDAGAIVGILRKFGFVGPKLAIQAGDEEALARQAAEEAGVPFAPWVVGVATGLVKDACDSLEMDVRLAGGHPQEPFQMQWRTWRGQQPGRTSRHHQRIWSRLLLRPRGETCRSYGKESLLHRLRRRKRKR